MAQAQFAAALKLFADCVHTGTFQDAFGTKIENIPILVASRLLKPLGNPPPNSVKFFAATEVVEQAGDRTWLAKVTNALNQHWQRRNAAKKTLPLSGHAQPVRAMARAGGGPSLPAPLVQGREQAGS